MFQAVANQGLFYPREIGKTERAMHGVFNETIQR